MPRTKVLIISVFSLLCPILSLQWTCDEEAWLCEECRAAGQEEDEAVRYQLMVSMRERVENVTEIAEELDNLIWVADHWANGRDKYWSPDDDQVTGEDGYLGGWFMFRTTPWGVIWPIEPRDSSPAHPLWSLYRGRMLIWNGIENGFRTEDFYKEGQRLLGEAQEVFPENQIIKQYFEDSWVDGGDTYIDFPEGWAWVGPQHRAIVGMKEVIRFWCEKRQAPDGQLGGGWGDDVEMWREWVVILLGFKELDLEECWKNVAIGALARPSMSGGYTDRMTDVEHSAEETADTLTSLLHLDPTNTTWQEWAGDKLVSLATNMWMGINHHGRRQFKSTYFTSEKVSDNSLFACDTAYHSRALQPSLLAWQRGDYRPGGIILEWLETYLIASESEERGKPRGVIPSAISWPSGTVGGWPTTSWDNPGCHYSEKTYAWPRSVENIMKGMLLAFHLTGQQRFLDPIKAAAEYKRMWLRTEDAEENSPWGTKGLKVHDVLAMYRDDTGDKQYDDIIISSGDDYQKFVVSGDIGNLASQLKRRANLFLNNREVFTSEVRFSDRMFKFKSAYIDHVFNTTMDTSSSFQLLYSTVTGSVSGPGYFPMPHVKWWMNPEDVSVLVRKVIDDEETGLMFQKKLEMRIWSHVDAVEVDVRFELMNVETVREEAKLVCDGSSEIIFLLNNGDGSFSFSVRSNCPCILYVGIN